MLFAFYQFPCLLSLPPRKGKSRAPEGWNGGDFTWFLISLWVVIAYEPLAGQQTQLSLCSLFSVSDFSTAAGNILLGEMLFLWASSYLTGLSFSWLFPLSSISKCSNSGLALLFYWCITNYHKFGDLKHIVVSLGQKSGHSLTRSSVGLQSRCHRILGYHLNAWLEKDLFAVLLVVGRIYFLEFYSSEGIIILLAGGWTL